MQVRKQDVIDEICDLLPSRPRLVTSRGSTEPKALFVHIINDLGLTPAGNRTKPMLARLIAASAGLLWDATCDSTGTESGGGSTVTLSGLSRVLAAVRILAARPTSRMAPFGQDYVRGKVFRHLTAAAHTEIDLDGLDRANERHMNLQDAIADLVRERGLKPLSPLPSEPQYDLAWVCKAGMVVCEVKTASQGDRQQFRLGIGQLVEYRHAISMLSSAKVHAVLAVDGVLAPFTEAVAESVAIAVTTRAHAPRDLRQLLV